MSAHQLRTTIVSARFVLRLAVSAFDQLDLLDDDVAREARGECQNWLDRNPELRTSGASHAYRVEQLKPCLSTTFAVVDPEGVLLARGLNEHDARAMCAELNRLHDAVNARAAVAATGDHE